MTSDNGYCFYISHENIQIEDQNHSSTSPKPRRLDIDKWFPSQNPADLAKSWQKNVAHSLCHGSAMFFNEKKFFSLFVFSLIQLTILPPPLPSFTRTLGADSMSHCGAVNSIRNKVICFPQALFSFCSLCFYRNIFSFQEKRKRVVYEVWQGNAKVNKESLKQ